MIYKAVYATPSPTLGKMLIVSDDKINICGLYFSWKRGKFLPWINECEDIISSNEKAPCLEAAKEWLDAYFSGENPPIPSISLAIKGSKFQSLILRLLCEIPYGQTVTYGEIAKEAARLLSKERMSAQAVGNAVGGNPISIIIPCHRVMGKDGKLTGYGGGIERKVWLLRHEGVDTSNFIYPNKQAK